MLRLTLPGTCHSSMLSSEWDISEYMFLSTRFISFITYQASTDEASLEIHKRSAIGQALVRHAWNMCSEPGILPTADGKIYREAEEVVERGPGRSSRHVDPQAHQG